MVSTTKWKIYSPGYLDLELDMELAIAQLVHVQVHAQDPSAVELGEWKTPWGCPILELQGDSHWSSPVELNGSFWLYVQDLPTPKHGSPQL